ncbi:MAG: hypothetical protein FWC13_09405 [Oscillospiraceae bacterium]|nr:hypothetical protein [Oscillospiraceae bacterium]
MIDLHTHILPGIDDGAASVEESLALVEAEIDSGVTTIALTPHFYPERMSLAEFLDRRERAFLKLQSALGDSHSHVKFLLGAEVAYSPTLPQLNLAPLCYEGTTLLLVELPWTIYPSLAPDVLYKLQLQGYTPILAHVERFLYFVKSPWLIENLIDSGCFTQSSADALLGNMMQRRIVLNLIKNGLIHTLASDTHGFRSPRLDNAAAVVAKKLGDDIAHALVNFDISQYSV